MKKRTIKIGIIIVSLLFLIMIALQSDHNDRFKEISLTVKDNESKEEETLSNEQTEESAPKVFYIEENPLVGVVITTTNFSGSFHDKVNLSSASKLILKNKEDIVLAEYPQKTEINVDDYELKVGETLFFASDEDGKIRIDSIQRAQGIPEYAGVIEVRKEEEGYVIINHVPLEEYLLTVVPSEMPAAYPAEALKAQAVCARSYAAFYLYHPAFPEWNANMDDSTNFQVYNNMLENDHSSLAVHETEGYVLKYDNEPMQAYFFSTSCGYTTIEKIWKPKPDEEELTNTCLSDKIEENIKTSMNYFDSIHISDAHNLADGEKLINEDSFTKYITQTDELAYEKEEPWFRWSYVGIIDEKIILERLKARFEERPDLILTQKKGESEYSSLPISEVNAITDITVTKRLDGGVADELVIETKTVSFLIIGEYNIRYILSDGESDIRRNDGSDVKVSQLLPSAYFVIDDLNMKSGRVIKMELKGGGYGHGVGMSQNGAKAAANNGLSWKEILRLFYTKGTIEQLV